MAGFQPQKVQGVIADGRLIVRGTKSVASDRQTWGFGTDLKMNVDKE